MICKKKALLYACHVVVPLLLGAGIYVHCTGDTYITLALHAVYPKCLTSPPKWDVASSALLRLLRFYFCDAVWAYSLTFSIAPLIGAAKDQVIWATTLSLCFCVLLELLQLSTGFIGTFDSMDLATEVTSCIIAGSIFYKQFGRK